MDIARRILADIDHALQLQPAPRVKAVHLPPQTAVGTKDGEFGAVELDDGTLGLSYVLLDGAMEGAPGGAAHKGPGARWIGADARALARQWVDAEGTDRTLGWAAVNALSRRVFDAAGWRAPDATDSIGGLDPQPGEHIGMIGWFPPLVRQVTACGARLTVLELRADLVGDHGTHRVTLEPRELHTCTQVLTTSTVLLNHTLEQVLAHCGGARRIAMVGPGAGCLPDALFDCGITALGGTWIEDGRAFVAALTAGRPWGASARKCCIVPSDCAAWADRLPRQR